jgi:hypothetical protein
MVAMVSLLSDYATFGAIEAPGSMCHERIGARVLGRSD